MVLSIIYLVAAIWLSIYGLNAFVLIYAYLRHRREQVDRPALTEYPVVTVQLPVYNEKHVVTRAIEALVQLDWPRDALQIQILDDSTDETTEIVRQCVDRFRREGVDIALFHRAQRNGYKAGALNDAMPSARGTLIAIFDADFCPSPEFLADTVPYLAADPGLGFVQARWGHLNAEYSMLTMAQSIALDGHFAIEHVARERAGWLTNFSGTGGLWRRACIEGCGGWDVDMLTEDVDLSYRAQLAGWRGLTLPDVVAPAEVPAQLAALKQQQFRWAKGNTQCLLKQGTTILRAPLPWPARIQALIHLSYYVAHPLMLVVMAVTLPLVWCNQLHRWALAFLSLATFGPPALYTLGQWVLYRSWWGRLRALPMLFCLGTGLALNSTVAIAEAVLGVKSPFQRTPKFQIEGTRAEWRNQSYTVAPDRLAWGEALLALLSLLTVFVGLARGDFGVIPFLSLYVIGFGFVSSKGLVQRLRRRR